MSGRLLNVPWPRSPHGLLRYDLDEAYCAARDIDLARSLNPELLTFDAWLDRNRALIPLG